jgi:hypothetical protein
MPSRQQRPPGLTEAPKDKLNDNFLDLCVAGSSPPSTMMYKPFLTALPDWVCAFKIVSKGQESTMTGCSYKGALPYFTVGAGVGLKMSFFSEFDISLNYNPTWYRVYYTVRFERCPPEPDQPETGSIILGPVCYSTYSLLTILLSVEDEYFPADVDTITSDNQQVAPERGLPYSTG